MSINDLEQEAAAYLVSMASDLVESYSEPEDYDAAVCAVLASALELASNRKLKPLEEVYED